MTVRTRRSIAGGRSSPAPASPPATATRSSLRRASVAASSSGNGTVASKASSSKASVPKPLTELGVLLFLPNIIGAWAWSEGWCRVRGLGRIGLRVTPHH